MARICIWWQLFFDSVLAIFDAISEVKNDITSLSCIDDVSSESGSTHSTGSGVNQKLFASKDMLNQASSHSEVSIGPILTTCTITKMIDASGYNVNGY